MGDKLRKVKIRSLKNDNIQIKSPLERDDIEPSSNDMDLLNRLISISSPKIAENIKEEKKKKKKDKKEKKKGKKKDKKKKKDKLNLDSYNLFDDEDDEEFVPENKKQKVDKSNDDFYEYRFNASLVMLRDLLSEVNGFTEDSKKYLEVLKKGGPSGRMKVSPMSISSQTSNVVTLMNTKLSILKEVTSVNKSISDLELKKMSSDQKVNAGKENENDSNFIIDKMFDKILSTDMPDTEELVEYRKKKSKKRDISLDDRVKELEDAGEIEFTDNEKAFKYENNVEICIEKDMKTGRWNFFAQTLDGDEIGDYPLPNKKTLGRMEFSDDKNTAVDKLGNVYTVYLK